MDQTQVAERYRERLNVITMYEDPHCDVDDPQRGGIPSSGSIWS